MNKVVMLLLLLQLTNVLAVVHFRNFDSERDQKLAEAWIKDMFSEAQVALDTLNEGSPEARSSVSSLFADKDVPALKKVLQDVIRSETDPAREISIYGNEAHLRQGPDGNLYDSDYFHLDANGNRQPHAQPLGGKPPVPLHQRISYTTQGYESGLQREFDARGQVHIVFAQTLFRQIPETQDSRAFSTIRESGLFKPSIDQVTAWTHNVFHEFVHAVSGGTGRGGSVITDAQHADNKPHYGWGSMVGIQQGRLKGATPALTADSHTIAFKTLCLTKIQGKYVSWVYGRVNPKTLKPMNFQGEDVEFNPSKWSSGRSSGRTSPGESSSRGCKRQAGGACNADEKPEEQAPAKPVPAEPNPAAPQQDEPNKAAPSKDDPNSKPVAEDEDPKNKPSGNSNAIGGGQDAAASEPAEGGSDTPEAAADDTPHGAASDTPEDPSQESGESANNRNKNRPKPVAARPPKRAVVFAA